MSNKLLSIFFAGILALSFVGIASAQSCLDIHATPNGCAPSPLDGSVVNLTGSVYVVAGTYNSGSVYFQCSAGGGLTFFESGSPLGEGDLISITGTVSSFGDEIQLSGASWSILGTQAPVPNAISTGSLAIGGDFLGDFMRVQGVLAHVSTGFNSVYTVDDGSGPVIVFVDGSTGIDTAIYDQYVGDLVSVIGATKCFGSEGEILPRRDEDLQLVTIPLKPASWGELKANF